ncbi:hypothetical protein KAFR_0B00590 [Kazachstania africana CBS 2517]|uniref:EH domain-containing and endocytosis protein 1 n=1 Tax=Kazachstania africana (strain ATCC 22294 / BCRC 22015 / CBS 2517 / CECT 1963 / NBRC 1671 / NRRL Y-8276) TaxID=1071382 RepID=H2APQ8_KAZAF|nr:hypothetical protein KAFR_0B00590 [Kazachstania africana CBS 2517]CCF56358.1 hypothetical protein KAFR_0B00590 [Kazachstania africana CBS 2517]
MASVPFFKTPLTPEETNFFNQKFKQLDVKNLGVVTGEVVRPLFASTNLPSTTLSQVWALADVNNKGFLNFQEFSAALRIIANLQKFPNATLSANLYDSPCPQLPTFNDGSRAPSASATTQLPLPSTNDIAKFSQLFDRTTNGATLIPGDQAKDIFLKARLSNQTLGEIWALCDRNASGSLDKNEFVMAMFLIQLSMSNHPSMSSLPAALPAHLWSVVANGTAGPISTQSTGSNNAPLKRQSTISRLSSGAFTNVSQNWSLSFEQKQQFDRIFDALDKNHAGSLGSQVLVPFFVSSKLSQETLATIWDLADIHNNAEFTKMEFAIAMFLIQKKNSGVDLPDVIPNELLHSPALGLSQQQPTQPPATIPSRATKPSFNEPLQQQPQHLLNQPAPPVQQQNSGSLNDLLALNSSFTSPSPSNLQANNVANNTGSPSSQHVAPHSSVGLKKFHPTSQFGQTIIKEEEEEEEAPKYSQQSQQLHSSVSPAHRTASVTLAQVPNFANLSISNHSTGSPMNAPSTALRNNDLYADADASAQLSKETTELANLSNQVNSLTKQASITNDKKSRASQELKRVIEMKLSIQDKLGKIRAAHEENVKKTEMLENQLIELNNENNSLQQQFSVTEANFQASENKMNEVTLQFNNATRENQELKAKISQFNEQNNLLLSQLNEKQALLQKEMSIADVNRKQVELNDITVANLTNEISGLDEKLQIFISKTNELNDYQKTLESKHAQLEDKYNDLNERESQLNERTKQIEEQEQLYNENIKNLQIMFDELAGKKQQFEKAENELKQQHLEYAAHVQELSERQLNLAMGELPDDAEDIIAENKKFKEASAGDKAAAFNEDDVAKFVDGTVANSKLVAHENENDDELKTENTESDVFDKNDLPATDSVQGENDNNTTATTISNDNRENLHENENLSDRFEGDLNEYGIPRTQSFTSSVANNAPQSVRDENEAIAELPEGKEEMNGTDTVLENEPIPGEWSSTPIPESAVDEEELPSETVVESQTVDENESDSDRSIQQSPVQVALDKVENPTNAVEPVIEHPGPVAEGILLQEDKEIHPIDQEFPPIQELEINESDSSSEDEFEDTRDVLNATPTNEQPRTSGNDEFADEFAGLEQAALEEDEEPNDNRFNTDEFMEPFEPISHTDLDEELDDVAFVGTNQRSTTISPEGNAANVSNDEWDEIFAGFGNGRQPAPAKQEVSQAKSSVPIDRGIATTPKSLAIEELSGMGFAEEEAKNALEKCNWDLEAATNLLLDGA